MSDFAVTYGSLHNFPEDERLTRVFAELGPLPALSTKFPGGSSRGSSEEFLRAWISDPKAHLLVISGGYGSGKSHLLDTVVRLAHPSAVIDHAVEEIPNINSLGDEPCIFVDHFDEVPNYSRPQNRAPDLRSVAQHLKKVKVCLVTKRPLTDKSHELVRQLRYRSRLDALGVQNLELLAIEAWPAAAVQRAIDVHLPSASKHFSNIVASLSPSDMGDLLRPMVLRMLLAIISKQPEEWIPEYGEIYEQYLEHALSWAYDQGRSLINSLDKRLVLTSLAYSMFSGKDSPIRNPRFAGAVSAKLIGEKLDEVRRDNRSLIAANYDPLNDFLLSNGCLIQLDSSSDRISEEFRFGSSAIFEYFLAQALVDRYLKGNGIGVREDSFNPGILDTRMLYFARRALGKDPPEAIMDLLMEDNFGNIDRLILLYLVEDKPQFINHLLSAPDKYFSYLMEVGQKNDSHFMVKIARFQLVSSGRMSASEYLDYVQLSEEPSHLEVELEICRTPTGNLDYLESRFANPNLRNSAAISIYRIAQLDPTRAKTLVEHQNFLSDVQVRECKDAFNRALESNARRLRPSI